MNWKFKALSQLLFSYVPFGNQLNYGFQRYVTKKLPAHDSYFLARAAMSLRQIDCLSRHLTRPLGELAFYEFGSGADLTGPLLFYASGVDRQTLVDVTPLARAWLINDTVDKFRRLGPTMVLARVPTEFVQLSRGGGVLADLRGHYGIDYRAPIDARKTGIADKSIDCITSHSTIEHVPAVELPDVLAECYRILKDDGLMAMRIDYEDHYSYFDRGISRFNFLQYSEQTWRWYSPPLHYQNRLRHSDILGLFEKLGFAIVEAERDDATVSQLEEFKNLRLDDRFRKYSATDLAVRKALVVLKKRLH